MGSLFIEFEKIVSSDKFYKDVICFAIRVQFRWFLRLLEQCYYIFMIMGYRTTFWKGKKPGDFYDTGSHCMGGRLFPWKMTFYSSADQDGANGIPSLLEVWIGS